MGSASAESPVPRFRADVEGMRAVAILLVVLFHAGFAFVPGGYVGVDVFFVLSGFLITGLLVDELRRTGTVSIPNFYARRIRRLLPASTVVLVATALVAYVMLPALDRPALAADVKAAALWFANWHFAAGSTQYMADTDKSAVLHYWSLSVEEQFYVVWPLLLLLVVGRSRLAARDWAAARRRVVAALIALGGASLFVSWSITDDAGPWAYFGLHTRAWELAAGAGLALAREPLARLPRRWGVLAGWAGLGVIVLAAATYDADTAFPGVAAMLPVGGTALLVAAGASGVYAGVSKALTSSVLMYIGRVSYAWYLWHWPLLTLAPRGQAVDAGGAEAQTAKLPLAAACALVAASFLLAVATHYMIEQPVRLSSYFAKARRTSLAVGGALTVGSVVAAGAVLAPSLGVGFLKPWTGPPAAAEEGVAAEGGTGAFIQPEPTNRATAGRTAARISLPPHPLAKTPDAARKDWTLPVRRCGGWFQDVDAGADCQFGDPNGARTMVLIGDSHATQWLPAVRRVALDRGWKLYLWKKSGCSLNDVPIWLYTNKKHYTSCDQWRANVLARLKQMPTVDAVVLARFAGYHSMVLKPSGERTTRDDVESYWRGGAERTFQTLLGESRRIVVLRDNPWPLVNVPSCLSKNGNRAEACNFPRDGHVHLDEPLYRGERAAARGNPRISFLDFSEQLCPGAVCPVKTKDGVIMYADVNHVSGSLAYLMTDAWRRALVPVVEPKRAS